MDSQFEKGMRGVEVEEEKELGRVQLRSATGEVILVPKPSSDPNDPLNWYVNPEIELQEHCVEVLQVSTFQVLRCNRDMLWHVDVYISGSRTNCSNYSTSCTVWIGHEY